MSERPRVGVSHCLLGKCVRYDGQHKHDRFLTETLGKFVEFVPVCPEVECGLPVPREAMRLVGDPAAPRLLTQRSKIDHTDRMLTWCERRLVELRSEDLVGFIFKTRSPSSGMVRVKIYDEEGVIRDYGSGLFAGAFMKAFPELPCEDDGRMHDSALRENWVERVFTLWRFREERAKDPSLKALMGFHARNKYLFMAHSPEGAKVLGRLLAGSRSEEVDATASAYESEMMRVLAEHATLPRHVNVLQHLLGYFKEYLAPAEKRELLAVFDQYLDGVTPLIVPVTLVQHYVRKYEVTYLMDQYYLNPHPLELNVRNHV